MIDDIVMMFCILLSIFLPCVSSVVVPWLDNDPFASTRDDSTINPAYGGRPPVLPPSDLTDGMKTLPHEGFIPQYVIDYCPLVHLYSEERYWPSDVSEFIHNFQITTDDGDVVKPPVLNLKDLTEGFFGQSGQNNMTIPSKETYLTSLDDFDSDPRWLLGHTPEYGTGYIKNAPAVLIVVDKGNGWVDAYWFYFYAFNLGPFIMGYGPWGNHVGDWEHSLVRFYKGEPEYVWMSAHGGGGGYKFDALEKLDRLRRVDGKNTGEILKRPLIFSARGTHANYASVGQHAHDVPFFFSALSDFTDRGPLWDPSLNFLGYTYDGTIVTPSSQREAELGTDWLYFKGHWGDKQLPRDDKRQKWCPVQWRYIDGPSGPLTKHLERTGICQRTKWWNFWNGCPARRTIKRGQGLDAERNDLVGDNCGVALYRIRPKWLRSLVRLAMWRGAFCFVMDYFTG